jgi:hypothetical protein
MRRIALALSLGLITTLTAPAMSQDAARDDVDPGALMKTAMGKTEAAQEARNTLRELPPAALMPFKDKILANLKTVRRSCEKYRMERVKALAKRSRGANEAKVKALRAQALKLISTYTKAQQKDVDELVNQIKALIYVPIPAGEIQTDKIRTAMYGWYLFRDLAIKTGSLTRCPTSPSPRWTTRASCAPG